MTPSFGLRIYPYGDPRTFWLFYRPSAVGGQWQDTGNMLALPLWLGQGEGPIPPPASLADIPVGAPVHGIHLWAPRQSMDWTGFYDDVRLQFGQLDDGMDTGAVHEPATSVFLLSGLALLLLASRLRPLNIAKLRIFIGALTFLFPPETNSARSALTV